MDWLINIINGISIFFDWIIYSLASVAYVIFGAMCELNVDAIGEAFSNLVGRVQTFLGVIMLFVVAFNLLKMLVDPDKSEQMTSKMVQKIAIAIILLVSMNYVFGLFSDFQSAIIKNSALEKIILGVEDNPVGEATTGYTKYIQNGKYFSYNLLFAFVTEDDASTLNLKENVMSANKPLWYVVQNINKSGVNYRYPIISGAVGILLTVIFISFALDVGVRAFTLILLQVIAPIPIIASISPKGDAMLEKYFKTYIGTYIQLFVKIGIIYITLYLMQYCMTDLLGTVSESGVSTMFPNLGDTGTFFKAMLFVIVLIALFMFSKKFPKLLGDIFGINLSSSVNPFKITGDIMKGGLGLGVGAVAGLTAGVAGGAGVLGTLGALGKGAIGGASSGARSKGIKDFVSGQSKNSEANKKWASNIGAQGGVSGIVGSKLGNAADKIAGNPSKLKANQAAMDKNQKAIDKVNGRVSANSKGTEMYNKIKSAGESSYLKSSGYSSKQNYIDTKTLAAKQTWKDTVAASPSDTKAIADAESRYRQSVVDAESSYQSEVNNYTSTNLETNAEINEAYKEYQNYVDLNKDSYDGKGIEKFEDIETAHETEISNAAKLSAERRSLEQERLSIEQEKSDITNSSSHQYKEKQDKYAASQAEKLGHYKEEKK